MKKEGESIVEKSASQEIDYMAKRTRKRAPGFKTEWKVILVLALFVTFLEVVSRVIAPTLDSAAEHIHEFPELVEEVKVNSNDSKTLLLFGNSLMKHGLDEERLQATIQSGIAVTKVTPVGTTIVDWTFLYKRYFENKQVHPDIIVVGFVRHHIADKAHAYPNRNRRLGRHFLAWEDQPLAWKTEFPNAHDAIQTGLSHFSAVLGDQPEHSLFLLQTTIPYYSEGLSLNNDWVNAWRERKQEAIAGEFPQQADKATYVRLQRFIDLMKSHKIKVCFVPVPQPTYYELDQEIIDTVSSNGMYWLDARELCIGEEYFSDGYHLGEIGKKKFTNWMSEQIRSLRLEVE